MAPGIGLMYRGCGEHCERGFIANLYLHLNDLRR